MISFGGEIYRIDADAFSKATTQEKSSEKVKEQVVKQYFDQDNKLTNSEVLETSIERGVELNQPKYDILRTMLDVILDEPQDDDVDDALGSDRVLEKKPLSYRIAFNTLLHYGILIQI